ncbi:tectonic-1-like isoform X1 [Mytilus galloprovincialis]|uniref:tectonic-1-like isoform X1 n=1 Tax=Mytilus galloprovincialis TaxID=29158 RepID=UPI003F7B7407
MAVKGEQVLVLACLLAIFLNHSIFVSCQTSPLSTETTTNDVTTTGAQTTIEETTVTTEAATTQAPTTTTTQLPTLPPTVVASVTDIAPCPCDLTGNACDVNCCCDLDCTSDDREVFSGCVESSGNVDDRICVQKEILLLENAPFPKNYTQDGLFCIYFDNYDERNYYNIPSLITDTTIFGNYVSKYAGYNYATQQTGQSTINNFYKVGDPVYIVYQSLTTGFLGLPSSLTSTGCSNSPLAYLKDETSSCVRQFTTLDQTTCESTSLSALSYYTGFRLVTTPYLFTYIVNGTVITTTTQSTTVTTTTPSPPVSTDNSTAAVTVPTTTTTAATTTTDTNITTTVTIVTTELPTTVAPSPIDLYNNTYTIDIGLSTVQCRDSAGNNITCTFPTGSVPAPTYNTVTSTCQNVVTQVEYEMTYDGTNGISTADVKFVLQDITTTNLPLSQTFTSKFTGVNDVNVTERSGNPGYIVGKPVRAGIRYINESFGNRNIIVENGYDLSLVKSSATGTCLTDVGNRVQVNFGQEMRSGCLISFNLGPTTMADDCIAMQQMINVALEGSDDYVNVEPIKNRYVATFGNSEPEQTGDWVPILQFPAGTTGASPVQNLDGPSCQLSMGMHIQVVYSSLGSKANPQAKILGVAFIYEKLQTITYTCSGSTCQPGNANVDQSFEISQSVSFVDVSAPATGAVGDAPIFIAKIPNDFFYPFGTGTGSSIRLAGPYLFCIALLTIIVNTVFV